MQKNEKKNKHMTLDDRMEVQECLEKSMTFKAIGRRIGKDPTTVSKEVKLHAQKHTNSFYNGPQNSDHHSKIDREHGRIEETERREAPCHEEATQ